VRALRGVSLGVRKIWAVWSILLITNPWFCAGVAAGLAADEEGGEKGGWGAEADLGLSFLSVYCAGVAAGLAADEEGGEKGGLGAEADLGLSFLSVYCAGVAAGLAADEEGGEKGGWGAEADLGLDDDGEPRDEFHDAEAGGEEGRALLHYKTIVVPVPRVRVRGVPVVNGFA
jgi:hypothetical protein